MKVLANIRKLATCRAEGGQGDAHVISDAAHGLGLERPYLLGWHPKRSSRKPMRPPNGSMPAGGWSFPVWIDCHTHLAFAGWRADEFVQRSFGPELSRISRSGGGILSTVRATRAAGEDELAVRAKRFLAARCSRSGITTVECKSGYGLDEENELKLLRVYRRLAARAAGSTRGNVPGCSRGPP